MCWTLTGHGYNDAWEILEKQQDESGDPIGLNIELVRASTFDNPYLDEGAHEQFERQYAGTARENQALHGVFEAKQGLVYDNFDRETHVIPHSRAEEIIDEDWRIYGYDYGWRDPRVLLEIGKTSYEQVVVVDEFHRRKSHIEDAIDWLQKHGKPGGTIYCDHEPSHMSKLSRAGYPTRAAQKDLDEGIEAVRKRLEPDGNLSVQKRRVIPSTFDGGKPIERVGLLVSEHCEHTVTEFLGHEEEDVGKSGAVDHCLDALRYAVMGVSKR